MNRSQESPKRSNAAPGDLIRRGPAVPLRPLGASEWSRWIERDGCGWYVPLGSRDAETAQRSALTIADQVASQGWTKAGARVPREFTMAIFWLEAPLACTYATMFTLPSGPMAPNDSAESSERTRRLRVAVVESDPVFRKAIVQWLETIAGCTVSGFGSLAELADAPRRSARVDVLLADRNDATVTLEKLAACSRNDSGPLVYPFGIYPSSDHIFMSFSGVEEGYLLRRRPLTRVLDPLDGAFANGRFLADEASRAIRRYCQGMFSPSVGQVNEAMRSALTLRERQILTCLQRGLHDKEIAGELRISPLTVHTHLKHIFEKLGAHTRTEAVVKYLEK